jgi:TolB-like protein
MGAAPLVAPPTPAPVVTATPRLVTPPPVATRAPQAGQPAVVVYPFTTPSDIDPKTGAAIAQVYEQVLTQSGGLKVLDTPSDIKREDFAKYAHAKGADYFISGYLQPIGNGAAIVAQIYDVNGDISVYSATTQIQSMQDVASQALTARDLILRAAGIDRPEINEGPANSPTPSATNGASESLNALLGGIFKPKAKSSAKPGATATPTPEPKPSRGSILAPLTGSVTAKILGDANYVLYRALDTHYKVTQTGSPVTDPAHQADGICGPNRNNVIVGGVLNAQHIGGFRAHDHYTFTLNVYACFGALLATYTADDDDYKKAIASAVQSYITDHPDNS